MPEKHDRSPLSHNIERLRLAKGWTQRELAGAAGISQTSLSHYEAGLASPGTVSLSKLARALGLTTEQLLSAAPQPQRRTS